MVRQREFCATTEVTVSPENVQKNGRLGLAAFYSNDYHYEIYYTEQDGSGRICLSRRIHDLEAVTAVHEIPEASEKAEIRLRIIADKESYRFYYRLGAGAPYVYLGCGDTAGLCTEITRTMTFTGVYFGMFAERATGAFREFEVTYKE